MYEYLSPGCPAIRKNQGKVGIFSSGKYLGKIKKPGYKS